MTYGVTPNGFVTKRLADIKAEIESDLRAAFGPGVNLDPRSPLGLLVGIFAERESLIWEGLEGGYNAMYPDTAEGVPLDNVAAITNITRKPESKSTVTMTITGTNGTVVPVGFIASVSGNPDARFVTIQFGTITGGTLDLLAEGEAGGPVAAPTGSLTVIETPVSGVSAVTNAADALLGQNRETDEEFRIRRLAELQRSGTATLEGIRNRVSQVPSVIFAGVVENAGSTVDGDGRPPHSFEVYVSGGDLDEIAEAIWLSKPAGIQTHGTITRTVIDSQGDPHSILFSRPTDKEVWLIINIVGNANPAEGPIYPVDGDDLVKAVVLEYGLTFRLGQDVIINQMFTPINTVPGVIGIEVLAGFSDPPTLSNNLSIAGNELAVFDSARITVNS